MNSRRIFQFTVASIVAVLGSSVALACSCAEKAPPCAAFGGAQAVFVGRVVGATEQREERNPDGSTTIYQVGQIHFKVEQSFRGPRSPELTIHSGTSGADCGYWFIKGKRYLVYAHANAGELWTGICGRTTQLPAADAEQDLNFLKALPRPGTGIRIYGTVVAALKDPKSTDWRKPKPISGITVKLEGKRTFDAVTGADGTYELTGLPPGRYTVYAEVPEGYYRGPYWKRKIEVADRGCAQMDFLAQSDSRISGRVLKVDGTGLARASLDLIPVEATSVRRAGSDSAFSNDDGAYQLAQVAPGSYLLGVNLTSPPDHEAPFPPTYYPGTTERSKAVIINVDLGEKLTDLDIRMPSSLTEFVVRGFVTWPDGNLASGLDVHLEDEKYPGWCINGCSQKTDAEGQFELRGYSGINYRVVALADGKPLSARPTHTYGKSDSFLLASDLEGVKVVLSFSGRPWDDRNKEKEKEKTEPQ